MDRGFTLRCDSKSAVSDPDFSTEKAPDRQALGDRCDRDHLAAGAEDKGEPFRAYGNAAGWVGTRSGRVAGAMS